MATNNSDSNSPASDIKVEIAAPLPLTYRAERGPAGEVIVRNVPIFAENKRKFGNVEVKYDRAWLERALEADKKLRSSGYKAPMHFGHHEIAIERDRAGHYELEAIGLCLYQNKPVYVVFGSLVFADEASFEKAIKKFPYRSVEIAGGDAPDQINSLALLSTEAPYFRFPNLDNITYALMTDGTATFSWNAPLKFEFPVGKNDKKKPKKDAAKPNDKPVVKPGSEKAPAEDTEKKPFGAEDDADAGENAAYGEEGGDENTAELGPDGKPVVVKKDASPDLNKVIEQLQGLAEIMQIISEKFGGCEKDENIDEDSEESSEFDSESEGDGSPMEVGVPVVAAKADVTKNSEIDKIIAKFEGTIDALKAKVAQMESERDNDKLFTTLKTELVSYQIPNLDKTLHEKIAKGAEVARAWAAGLQEGSSPAIKRSSEAPVDDAPAISNSKDQPEVEAYSKFGAEILKEARSLAAIYEGAPRNHFMKKQGLAAFLAAQPTLSEVK
jgi:hypothetical protein